MTLRTLRPYQEQILDAIAKARAAGQTRLLVKSPTGTGKTFTFASMLTWPPIAAWLDTFQPMQRRMLVIAHRTELLEQSAATIQAHNPGLVVMIEQADRYASPYADVVVASIQTLSARRCARLKRLVSRHGPFRIVVVDEAHHAAASSYRNVLVQLGFLPAADESDEENIEAPSYDDVEKMVVALKGWDTRAPTDRLLVGVTATPNRTDAIGLNCVFQTLAYSYGLKQAIADRWLVPITPWVVESDTNLDDVKITAGDFNQKQLAAAVNQAKRNVLAVAAWQEHARGRGTLAFTVDVDHAHTVAETFADAGVRAVAISGETPAEDRAQSLRAYTDGQIDLIANCMVLTEGTDLPRTSCILHLKPTKSATLYEQMTGRGLRLYPDKRDCAVIDVVDISRKHDLQAAPVLYGLPPGLLATGKRLDVVADGLEEFRLKYPNLDIEALLKSGHLTLEQLQAKAHTFDLWVVQDLGVFGQGRTMNWIKTGPDGYRLQYPWQDGTEIVTVQRDLLGQWEVALTYREHAVSRLARPAVRQRTIAQQIATADAAAVLAEAYVQQERRSVTKLKDKSAPWRGRPASDKQLQLLAKWRIPHAKSITMGQASDLLDLASARRGR